MAKDLVCGMDVDEKTAQYTTTYKGKTHYFCAPGCKKAFEENLKNTLTTWRGIQVTAAAETTD